MRHTVIRAVAILLLHLATVPTHADSLSRIGGFVGGGSGSRMLAPGDKVTLKTTIGRVYKDVKIVEIQKAFLVIEENGRTFRVSRLSLDEKSQQRLPSADEIESRERREKDYLKRIRSDPQYHYDHAIKDKYALQDGQLVEMKRRFGKILQVLESNTILFEEVVVLTRTRSTTRLSAVTLESTEGMVDGKPIVFPGLQETGTYSYTSALGAKRTVQRYSVLTSMTFEDYMELRKAGKNLPTGEVPKSIEPEN